MPLGQFALAGLWLRDLLQFFWLYLNYRGMFEVGSGLEKKH